MPNESNAARQLAFLQALFGPRDLVYLRLIDPDGRAVPNHFAQGAEAAATRIAELEQAFPGHNVYIGVASRRDESSAVKDNLDSARAVWIDLDCYGKNLDEELARLGDQGLPPSIVVASGGGLHVYWLLDEPFPLSTLDAIDRFEAINKGLAKEFENGDMSATDASRVLRPPGTTNYPNAKKRESGRVPAPVDLLRLYEDLTYRVEDFARFEEIGRAHRRGSGALANYERREWTEAEPPPRVLEVLARDAKARARFEGDAKGLNDESDSGVDMSLACLLALHGLEGWELEAAMRISRDRRGADEKHDGYFYLTVQKALAWAREQRPDAAEVFDSVENDGEGKVTIIVNVQRDELADKIIQAIVAPRQEFKLFRRGDAGVVQVIEREEGPEVRLQKPQTFLDVTAQAANYYNESKKGLHPTKLSQTESAVVLERITKRDHLMPLNGVIRYPVMRRDGSILSESGYDEQTGLFAAIDGIDLSVPEEPSDSEVVAARDALLEVLHDFPFEDPASQANALALLLILPLRELIEGLLPPFANDAPTPGTGKGLLTDAVLTLAYGCEDIGKLSEPGDEAEWRKLITSILLKGQFACVLDNINQPLRSASFASLLTATRWDDRALGLNKVLSLPNRTLWILTGNNLRLNPEISRRAVWIRMVPNCPRPEEREGFLHPNLLSWVRVERGHLLSAVFTLGRAWIARRRPGPAEDVPPMGSFEAFRDVVGGILRVAGVEGFLANRRAQAEQMDEEAAQLAYFIELWWDLGFGAEPIMARDLVRAVLERAPLREALPEGLNASGENLSTELGQVLSRICDRRFDLPGGAVAWVEKAGTGRGGRVLWQPKVDWPRTA